MKCPFCRTDVEPGEPSVEVQGLKAHARCYENGSRPYTGPTVRNFNETVSLSDVPGTSLKERTLREGEQ